MKPTPRETKKIHENYEKVKQHLIDEKYAVDADSADKIISGMSQDWFDTDRITSSKNLSIIS